MRNRAWRRAQNLNVIRKRQRIIRDCWKDRSYVRSTPGGVFKKWNFTCSCGMCKMSRYYGSLEKRRREVARSGKTRKDIMQDLAA